MTSHGRILCTTHRTYGMECSELDALIARSAGCCEACGTPEEQAGLGRLILDHDHRYGREAVRGLICSACNSQLSVLENYHPYRAILADQKFETYLSRAWFAQVARYVRVAGHLPYPADQDDQRMMQAALRTNSLVRVQKTVKQHPELSVSRFTGPGSLRLLITATYQTATPCRYQVRIVLRRLEGITFAFDQMSIQSPGSAADVYSDLSEGLRNLRLQMREDVRIERKQTG